MKTPAAWARFTLLLAMCTGGFVGSAVAGPISARVDRDPVSVDESFHLIFEAEGEIAGEPDFTKLRENFDILARSRSQNIGIENGRTVRSDSLRLTLLARDPGSFTIPAITFGVDRSNPVRVTVMPRTAGSELGGEPVFLEAVVDTHAPFVQQQVILTVRLYRAVDTSSASLSQPRSEGVETLIERLGDDHNYQSVRGAQRYHVVERKYSLFPQKSGSLTIGALEFKGEILARRGSPFDVFDRSKKKFVRARSEPIKITVREAPPGADAPWLPARSVKLREQWPEQTELRVGQPVTRTIEVEAEGLTAAQLPVLDRGLPESIKRYPEQPKLQNTTSDRGMIGTRSETVALVPTSAGALTLPAVHLSWWNTEQERFEVATIPARNLMVLPEIHDPLPIASDVPSAFATADTPGDEARSGVETAVNLWQVVSLGLALGWLLTLLLWWRAGVRKQRKPERDGGSGTRTSARRALSSVKQACATGDGMAAKDGLLAWAAVQWPNAPPRGLGEIARRVDPGLRDQVRILEAYLYGRADRWDAAALGAALEAPEHRPAQAGKRRQTQLEPLYPN